MSDLLELLKQQVSAIVLDGETEHLFEKNNALNHFYPIFLNLLKSKPQLIESLKDQLNPRLADLFQSNPAVKQQFLDAVSAGAPQSEIENTLSKSIIPALGFLQTEAGSADPEAIVHLIDTHQASINAGLPQWAGAILGALGVNSALGQTVHQAPAVTETVMTEEKKSSSWLPLLALIILALLAGFWFKSCTDKNKQDVPPAESASTAATGTQPASLALSTNDKGELLSCEAALNNQGYMDILQQQIKQIFNAPAGCGARSDDSIQTQFIDQDTIPSVLNLLKNVPNASLNWSGDQLTVSAATPAAAEALARDVKALAKNMHVSVQQGGALNDQASTVDSSITQAKKALDSINPDKVRALDVATALNMQIINFATGSSEIPAVNQSILDQAAALMQRARQVQLTITGHTDASGNAEENKKLSLQRAQSVADYLISKGVDPAQVRAAGMGQEKPIADNVTDEGKFKNRRIEFEVINTETGKVREVTNEGVKEAH